VIKLRNAELANEINLLFALSGSQQSLPRCELNSKVREPSRSLASSASCAPGPRLRALLAQSNRDSPQVP
jgi:hypothetical protein